MPKTAYSTFSHVFYEITKGFVNKCLVWYGKKDEAPEERGNPEPNGTKTAALVSQPPIQENPWKTVETLDINQDTVGTKATRKEGAFFGISERSTHIT